jgi:hypothetical protein
MTRDRTRFPMVARGRVQKVGDDPWPRHRVPRTARQASNRFSPPTSRTFWSSASLRASRLREAARIPERVSSCDLANARRAGLKIRWGNTRVGSSPTFGTNDLRLIATCQTACPGSKLVTALR